MSLAPKPCRHCKQHLSLTSANFRIAELESRIAELESGAGVAASMPDTGGPKRMYDHACSRMIEQELPWESLDSTARYWYAQCWEFALENVAPEKNARILYLEGLINTPHLKDFVEAVKLEAAHQVERWGTKHDAGKTPTDWFWLLGYLSGKALASAIKGDREKALHHTISSAAALLNWHEHIAGRSRGMRPGIEAPP